MSDQMPISYLAEKTELLRRAMERIEARTPGGFISTANLDVSEIRLNAQSLIKEIDKWREPGIPEAVIVRVDDIMDSERFAPEQS